MNHSQTVLMDAGDVAEMTVQIRCRDCPTRGRFLRDFSSRMYRNSEKQNPALLLLTRDGTNRLRRRFVTAPALCINETTHDVTCSGKVRLFCVRRCVNLLSVTSRTLSNITCILARDVGLRLEALCSISVHTARMLGRR